MAASIGHEVLFTGVDLLQFAPVPGLDTAGKILLGIWDAVEMVEVSVMDTPFAAVSVDTGSLQTNRLAALRLIERCANILISIRGEIADAGHTVAEELRAPIEKLVKCIPVTVILTHVFYLIRNTTQGVRRSPQFPQQAGPVSFS
jgi:abelson tyrosine-protein kinase 1